MRNRIIVFTVVCVTILSISLNVFCVNEQTNEIADNNVEEENKTLEEKQQEVKKKIEETNVKLEYVQNEISEAVKKVEEYDDSLNKYQTEYDELKNKINDLEGKIANADVEIEKLQEEYDQKNRLLKRRLNALYEVGDSVYLDILLSSDGIIDFISNYFMIGELLEYDSNLLEEVDSKKSDLVKRKDLFKRQSNELKESKLKINKTSIVISNMKKMKEVYVSKLSAEERAIQEEIEKYKQEQAEIERQILAAINWTGTYAIQFTNGVMIWPVATEGTVITSGYGGRTHPIQGIYKVHTGIDISAANIYGGPAVSAYDGIVSYAGWLGGYGNCVIVNHGNGISTLYGHGSEIVTQVGKTVKQGEIIMKIGSTGNSTGPHLHFEVRINGTAVDPIPYLNGEVINITNEKENQNDGLNTDEKQAESNEANT